MPVTRRGALAVLLSLAVGCPVHAAPPEQSVAIASTPRCGDRPAEPAPLTLVVNGVSQGIAMVMLCATDAFITVADLSNTTLPMPAALRAGRNPADFVSAQSLAPDITFFIDTSNLTLDLTANPRLLPRTSVSLATVDSHKQLATASTSGFLNYTVSTSLGSRARATNAFLQAGVSVGAGTLTATGQYSGSKWQRGLSALSFESQRKLTRFTLGEELAATSALGGSAVVAGLGFTRHFEFQSDFVYFPTAGVSGTVLTPTTADVYVNGSYLRTVDLPPGQFDLSEIPVPPGSSVTQVVLHDGNGGTQTIGNVFYSTRELLRRGVSDFDYHLGLLRPSPFGLADRYGALAALGDYRLGVTNAVSAGLRIEKTAGIISGGPSLDFAVPIGQFNLEAADSLADGRAGNAIGAAYQVQALRSALTVSAQTMSEHYATVSLDPTAGRTRSAIAENLSIPLTHQTLLELAHITTTSEGLPAADHISASTSARVGRDMTVSLNAARDRGGSFLGVAGPTPNNSWTVGFATSLRLGQQTTALFNAIDAGGATSTDITVSKNAPSELGFGYMIDASSGNAGGVAGSMTLHAQPADFQLLANAANGSPFATTAIVSGAIVGFKQGVFLTPPTGAGYALAQTTGFPGTRVFSGDQFAGRTDRNGNLVVTNLTAYNRNGISIDEMNDRPDVVEDSLLVFVKPKLDAGVVAPFAIRRFHAYVGRVVVERGGSAVVPAFGILRLEQNGIAYQSDIGSNGQFYYDGPPGGAFSATVLWSAGTCTFSGNLPVPTQTLTRLGVLTCAKP